MKKMRIIYLYYILLNSKQLLNFIDFIKDLQVGDKINDVLERYNTYPYSFQAETGYDALCIPFVFEILF